MTFPYSAVLFDLDGVLVDSEVLANRVWVELLAEHGLLFTHQEFMARSVGRTYPVLYHELHRDFGWTPPEGFAARNDAALAAAFADVPVIEGAGETLRALHAAGVPLAVASNSRRDRLDLKLRASGLAALVGDHAYDSEQVGGRGKPLPDLYQHAAQALGVDVRRCLVIEDSATGVQAGAAAGATVWGLLAGGHVHEALPGELLAAGATRIIGSHAELRAALNL
ncbi:HAD family hydrolase [Deinococcus ruber]|uniref:Beta-phosphoglucomutase n=1 Tax=Deinococcus ruber TaxID=1848197 RepID=A0A918BVF1_9DEIO|nr:HAD-IA family hydrolase [Deinococcus ruber]GGQ92435.1 beta-phosphoglucomutase [Deinococcus ruber]